MLVLQFQHKVTRAEDVVETTHVDTGTDDVDE